jgi:hydrogenase expression/formation protein HypC
MQPFRARAYIKESAVCLGIPGKVIAIDRQNDVLMGKVDFDGVCKCVCLEAVPEIAVGEYALVHVGFAIARIDEEEARKVFAFLDQLKVQEELGPGDGT